MARAIPRFPASSSKSGCPIITNVAKPHCWFDPDIQRWVCGNYRGRSWAGTAVDAVTRFHGAFKWRYNWRRSRWVCLPKSGGRGRYFLCYAGRTQPNARSNRRG